jgi:hypothetical protein
MRVVCINDAPLTHKRWDHRFEHPKKGRIYTVVGRSVDPVGGKDLFILDEIKNSPAHNGGYWTARFVPVKDRKTDISIFTAMLTKSKVRA